MFYAKTAQHTDAYFKHLACVDRPILMVAFNVMQISLARTIFAVISNVSFPQFISSPEMMNYTIVYILRLSQIISNLSYYGNDASLMRSDTKYLSF